VQDGCADYLDVEVALADRPNCRLADAGKRFRKYVVELLAGLEPLPKLTGLRAELVGRKRLDLLFEVADLTSKLNNSLVAAAFAGPQNLVENAHMSNQPLCRGRWF
jgi:hypothetical protein